MNRSGTLSNTWVFRLILINVLIYLVQGLSTKLVVYFGLIPAFVVTKGYVWQLVTYMFLHGNFWHIFLNMYALMIFGIPIEQEWGSRRFLQYYFFTGVGAGITIFTINMIIGGGNQFVPTIGASGAVFGLLLAFGILYPDAVILIFFVIPMKAKYLVILYGALEFYSLISSGGQSNISHAGHLGGLLFGLAYFLFTRKRKISFRSKIATARFKNEMRRSESKPVSSQSENRTFLENILKKVKTSGYGSLTDDDIQHIKYMEIMYEMDDQLCIEDDFNINDEYCRKCDSLEACILRELKKYM